MFCCNEVQALPTACTTQAGRSKLTRAQYALLTAGDLYQAKLNFCPCYEARDFSVALDITGSDLAVEAVVWHTIPPLSLSTR